MDDQIRYSRQDYTIGKDVRTKISNSKILIVGLSSLSLEIIKNLALTGVNKIDIHKNKLEEYYEKTGIYFNINDDDKLLEEIRNLNPMIIVNIVNIIDNNNIINSIEISNYSLVILVNSCIKDSLNFNRLTHKQNIPFIMTGYFGLYGYIFNDFNENYIINDVDGENYEYLIIEKIDIDKKLITFKDPHNLSDNDILILKNNLNNNLNNNIEIILKQTINPFIIEYKNDIIHDFLEENITIIKKKIPQEIKFNSLIQSLNDPEFNICDYSICSPLSRLQDLHELNKIVSKFYETYNTLPRPWSVIDYKIFKKLINLYESKTDDFKLLTQKLCFSLKGNLLPLASIFGGIVVQEAIKCIGKKYIPIKQWMYIDYLDIITNDEINLINEEPELIYKKFKKNKNNIKYEGFINIFGKELFNKIQNTKTFIVGAGAIGCELLKNIGMIGCKNIHITDMDNIEKSNLSRQFLFTDDDIHKSKSLSATNKIKKFNPDCIVSVYEKKVCTETEDIFNKDFYENIDIILNALDNVEARIYVDKKSIEYKIPLIDSGTMGTKGSVQVILPFLTESYGSSSDQEDKNSIPICTIKSFPYKQEHTIQWSRELFESEFIQIPNLIIKLKNLENLDKLNDNEIKNNYRELFKYNDFKKDINSYIKLLFYIFYDNYINSIDKLIKENQNDKTKKLPDLINFSDKKTINNITEFIITGLSILNQIFNTKIYDENNYVSNINYENFINFTDIIISDDIQIIKCELIKIIINLSEIEIINKIEFDKDNDDLNHVDWIVISSNIRNNQYKINETDKFTTRKIAGNIIPALITTTSIVAGFQIMEYFKIIKFYDKIKKENNNVEHFNNKFVNSSINYYDSITPASSNKKKLGEIEFSLWDRFESNSNSTSHIIKQMENYYKNKVEFMIFGNSTVYDGETILIENINLQEKKTSALFIIKDVKNPEKEIEIEIPIYYK